VNVKYDTTKKLAHLVEYLQIYWTDFRNFFTIWKHSMCWWWICISFANFSREVAMANRNEIMLRKCYQRRLIPLAFVVLVLKNELQYHGLAVRVNSRDDGATSSKNLMNFCLVTPKMAGLICIRLVWHGQQVAYIVEISKYTGPVFAVFSPYESTLRADDGSVSYFPICQGTLPWQPNNIAIMKANWCYLLSLHVRQMLARFWFTTTC